MKTTEQVFKLENGLFLEPFVDGERLDFYIDVLQLKQLHEKQVKGAGILFLMLNTHFYGNASDYGARITLEELKQAASHACRESCTSRDFGLFRIVELIQEALETHSYTVLNKTLAPARNALEGI